MEGKYNQSCIRRRASPPPKKLYGRYYERADENQYEHGGDRLSCQKGDLSDSNVLELITRYDKNDVHLK